MRRSGGRNRTIRAHTCIQLILIMWESINIQPAYFSQSKEEALLEVLRMMEGTQYIDDSAVTLRTGLAIAEPLNGIRGVRAITQALFFALIHIFKSLSRSALSHFALLFSKSTSSLSLLMASNDSCNTTTWKKFNVNSTLNEQNNVKLLNKAFSIHLDRARGWGLTNQPKFEVYLDKLRLQLTLLLTAVNLKLFTQIWHSFCSTSVLLQQKKGK